MAALAACSAIDGQARKNLERRCLASLQGNEVTDAPHPVHRVTVPGWGGLGCTVDW